MCRTLIIAAAVWLGVCSAQSSYGESFGNSRISAQVAQSSVALHAGEAHHFALGPFQVLTLEASPVQ